MGGAVSFLTDVTSSKASSVEGYGLWDPEENKRIDHLRAMQQEAVDFIVTYIFSEVPVRYGHKNADPYSPLWMEVSPETLRRVSRNEGDVDEAMIRTVPTGVLIDKDCNVKIFFTFADLSYSLTVRDILSIKQLLKEGASEFMPVAAPTLLKAERHSLTIFVELPRPPGVVYQLDIQYAAASSRDPLALDGEGLVDHESSERERVVFETSSHIGKNWQMLVRKSWELPNLQSHTLDNLRPGSRYIFRTRYRTHLGWSEYSPASKIMTTLAAEPDPPPAPIACVVLSDSIQLFWSPPSRDNGSPVLEYVLQGRSVGGDFVQLYRGPLNSFVATGLYPDFAYSFQVAAINIEGSSLMSSMTSVKTPPKVLGRRKGVVDDDQLKAALLCREAWSECWDPHQERYFYFNKLTGTRQLDVPDAFGDDEDEDEPVEPFNDYSIQCTPSLPEEPSKPPKKSATEYEKDLRLKRYRLIRALHKNGASFRSSPTLQATPPSSQRTSSMSNQARASAPSLSSLQSRSSTAPMPMPMPMPMAITTIGRSSEGLVASPASPSKKDVFLMSLRRHVALADGFASISNASASDMRKRLRVEFVGEAGIDSGGVSKEALLLLSKQTMAFALRSGAMKKIIDRPILSKSCEDELNKIGITYGGFYYFFGRLVGKAVFDRQLLDVELPLTLISRINAESNDDVPRGSVKRLQKRPHIEELDRSLDIIQGMDPVLYASLQWILKNDITNVIYETFSVECSGESVDLCENGASIEVSENNKWEYVQLLCDWKIVHSVNAAVNSFLKGFYELVPSRELRDAGVTAEELLLMINGKQLVDIDEIRAYVVYQGSADFGEQHESVVWLWQALREFTDAERRDVLGFFTGSGRVPLDGFDPPLNITEGSDMSIDSLPRAHTCFNQLVIPVFSSYQIFKEKLLFAVYNTEGFELS